MRLEYNPRLLCYNLYCDTQEESEKMKNMMEESFKVTKLKNMIYAGTDSIKTIKTELNSIYGKVATDMAKDYIVVHRAKKPIIIFTKSILAIEEDDYDGTAVIYCSENGVFYVDEKYADVIKHIV